MAQFTLRSAYEDLFSMCSPSIRNRKKEMMLEALLRRKNLHELKLTELSARAARFRVEARARVKQGDQAGARSKLLEHKRALAGVARCARLVELCETSASTIDEDSSTFETVAILTEVQRHHRPDARAVARLDDALEGLRDLKMNADDAQAAIGESGLGAAVDDASLEAELQALLEEDADEIRLGLPYVPVPMMLPVSTPPTVQTIAPTSSSSALEESTLRKRGGPDSGTIPA